MARIVWLRAVPALLVLLGAEMRIRQLAGNRSLWLDEALVADSIVHRGFVALATHPLRYDQAAPLLWLWAQRAAVDAFGPHDWALRLVPALSGLAVLVASWVLARRVLPAWQVPVAVLLVVGSPALLYYSTEIKPYETDAAVVLLLVLAALRADRPRRLLALGVAGAVAVWASSVAPLALAGLTVLVVADRLVHRRVREAATAAALLSPWALSFAMEYLLVLAPLRRDPVLQHYWSYAFPNGRTVTAWARDRAVDLADSPLHLTAPRLGLGLLAVGAGLLLARGKRGAYVVVPAVTAAVAGAASLYPLAGRLALYLVPLSAMALAAVVPDGRRRVGLALAVGLLAVTVGPTLISVAPQTARMHYVEELRPVLAQVARQKGEGEPVLVDVAAEGAFDYYAPTVGLSSSGVLTFATPPGGGRCSDRAALDAGGFGVRRVWLVFSHRLADAARLGDRPELVQRLLTVTSIARHITAPGAEAYLFDPTLPRRPAPAVTVDPQRCLGVYATRYP